MARVFGLQALAATAHLVHGEAGTLELEGLQLQTAGELLTRWPHGRQNVRRTCWTTEDVSAK